MLCQTFDQVTIPGVDIQDGILPSMKNYYLAAQTLNTVLVNAYGERYQVLTPEAIAAIDSAFEEYRTAFRTGKTTESALASMQVCISQVREILATRYNAQGALQPK
jgi:hypothetical protein